MKSIRARVVTAAVIAVLIGSVAALLVTDLAYRNILNTTTAEALESAQRNFEGLRQARVDIMGAALEITPFCTTLREAFIASDRETLQEVSWKRFEALRDTFGISRWYYYEPGPEGTVFLRVYRGAAALDPGAYGDASTSKSLVRARDTGEMSSGFEVGRQALSLRVIAPFADDDGEVIGYIGLGERIHDYLEKISGQTGDDYALFLRKDLLNREAWRSLHENQGTVDDWDDYAEVVLADNTRDDVLIPGIDMDVDHFRETHSLGVVSLGERAYSTGTFPIVDVTGTSVGFVYVMQDVTELTAVFRAAQIGLLLSFLALAVGISVVVTLILERVVFNRIDTMVTDMERMSLAVAAGDWQALRHDNEPPDDEIGRFERFLGSFLALVAAALRARRDDGADRGPDAD